MKNLITHTLREKNILIRVDLNVPVVNGIVTEKSRIILIEQTILKLQEQKNKIFLISHFGRPKGEKNKKYSLKFLCPILEQTLKLKKIFFLDDFEDKEIQKTINTMNPGDICLMENIRFYPEEEINDLNFAKKISKNFDAFVNDAFSASHRSHTSIIGIPRFLPSYAGYGLLNEIENIDKFIDSPNKPNLAIIGGSKISTKIDLISNLSKSFSSIIIGGAMANTFLHAKGINIGNSVCEKNLSETALFILEQGKKNNCNIILPVDVVCAENLNDKDNVKEVYIDNILSNQMIFDLGSQTIKIISKAISEAKMILWNGPLGAFEYPPFQRSSIDLAKTIKENSENRNIFSIAGGGDTISVIKLARAETGFSYISKAGGAFLEWLEGKESEGIKALKK